MKFYCGVSLCSAAKILKIAKDRPCSARFTMLILKKACLRYRNRFFCCVDGSTCSFRIAGYVTRTTFVGAFSEHDGQSLLMSILLWKSKLFWLIMPPPFGAGGNMFSGCPSVSPSDGSFVWSLKYPLFHLYMGLLVHPTNSDRFAACPSVCPSVRRGFRAFAGERMEGMAWNVACRCIFTTFRTD